MERDGAGVGGSVGLAIEAGSVLLFVGGESAFGVGVLDTSEEPLDDEVEAETMSCSLRPRLKLAKG